MVFTVLLRLCVVLCILSQINGFADWMTKDFCRRSMSVGEVLMNAEVTASDERTVLVFRGEQELHSGDVYVPGEVLEVRVSDSKPQYVLEVIGPASAQFTAGGCDGTRIANKPRAELNLPIEISAKDSKDAKLQEEESQEELEDDGDGSVKIHVAWATGHSTVYLSPDFILLPKKTSEIAASASNTTSSTTSVSKEKEDRKEEATKDTVTNPSSNGDKDTLSRDTLSRDTPTTKTAVSPAKSPAYVPSTVTTKNQAPLNASLAAWQESLSRFASSSLNTTLHSLKHTFPLHHLNHTTANDLVSRTGKLFSDLEKAALEELASSSGRVSQSLGGVADTHERVALQMQLREKRQQLEKEKRQQLQLRGSGGRKTQQHVSRHTHSETQDTVRDTAQDTGSADATRDTVSLEQRKRDKVRVLQQQRHTKSHDTAPPRTSSLHFQESETVVDSEGDDTEEEEEEEESVSSAAAAVSRRHKNESRHVSRHPVLRMLIRVVLVLGLLFLATICCGSAMLVWHGRHAVWRAFRRKLGLRVSGDDKQQN